MQFLFCFKNISFFTSAGGSAFCLEAFDQPMVMHGAGIHFVLQVFALIHPKNIM